MRQPTKAPARKIAALLIFLTIATPACAHPRSGNTDWMALWNPKYQHKQEYSNYNQPRYSIVLYDNTGRIVNVWLAAEYWIENDICYMVLPDGTHITTDGRVSIREI